MIGHKIELGWSVQKEYIYTRRKISTSIDVLSGVDIMSAIFVIEPDKLNMFK